MTWKNLARTKPTRNTKDPKPPSRFNSKRSLAFLIDLSPAGNTPTTVFSLDTNYSSCFSQITLVTLQNTETFWQQLNKQSKWLMTKISLPLSLTTVPECAKVSREFNFQILPTATHGKSRRRRHNSTMTMPTSETKRHLVDISINPIGLRWIFHVPGINLQNPLRRHRKDRHSNDSSSSLSSMDNL